MNSSSKMTSVVYKWICNATKLWSDEPHWRKNKRDTDGFFLGPRRNASHRTGLWFSSVLSDMIVDKALEAGAMSRTRCRELREGKFFYCRINFKLKFKKKLLELVGLGLTVQIGIIRSHLLIASSQIYIGKNHRSRSSSISLTATA